MFYHFCKHLNEMKSVRGSKNTNLGTRNFSFEDVDITNYTAYFTENFGCQEEWYGNYIPHRNQKNLVQFLTFRFADSLPQEVLKEIKLEIQNISNDKKDIVKRNLYQYWLDQGLGCCALANREMAEVVMEAFKYHDGKKYDLLVWSIMPNHVHVLIWVKHDLSNIIQSWKSYTGKWGLAHNTELQLGIEKNAKAFWMSDYWDRFIRNEEHFNNTVRYILNNPVKARLPQGHIAYEFRGCNLA